MRPILCLVFISIVLTSSCSKQLPTNETSNATAAPENTQPTQSEADSTLSGSILGGQVAADANGNDKWPSTVGLLMKWTEGDLTHRTNLFCSGTLINPKLVITAAHCVDKDVKASQLKIYTGLGKEGGDVGELPNAPLFEVEKIIVHPYYLKYPTGEADLALIVLKNEITHIMPAPIISNYDEYQQVTQTGKMVTLVGFGRRDVSDAKIIGRKFEVGVPVKETPTELTSQTAFWVTEKNFGFNKQNSDDQKGSLSGDSGGPAYALSPSGQWKLLGVTSRGTNEDAIKYGMSNNNTYTLVPHFLCWVQTSSNIKLDTAQLNCDYDQMLHAFSADKISSNEIERKSAFIKKCKELDSLLDGKTEIKSVVKAQQNLLKVMRYKIAKNKSADCATLYQQTSALTELNLDATFLQDDSLLAYFPSIKKISLMGNRLQLLNSVSNTSGHYRVNIIGNKIGSIQTQELARLKKISAPNGTSAVLGLRMQDFNYYDTDFLPYCKSALEKRFQDVTLTESEKTALIIADVAAQEVLTDHTIYGLPVYSATDTEKIKEKQRNDGAVASCNLANRYLRDRISLNLSDNATIKNLAPLANLEHIRWLDLVKVDLESLEGLVGLNNMSRLNIENNRVENLSVLATLPTLEYIDASGNKIASFEHTKAMEASTRLPTNIKISGKDAQNL